ncbi:MAG: hypothetical protein MK138_08105, partial [Planctomycetes bacterium]|nr:hypothetical protein [Planctomycetota bacterium]
MFWDYSLGDLLEKGGFIMWPLLCCSIAALALAIDRGLAHFRLRLRFCKHSGRTPRTCMKNSRMMSSKTCVWPTGSRARRCIMSRYFGN